MKTIGILLILTLMSCSSPTDKQIRDNAKDSLVQMTSAISDDTKGTLLTSSYREHIDSANFHIIRGKYDSGNKYINVYENKLTKLDKWKEYYENGQLKEEGTMTNGSHIYVGIWKYYSNLGKVDSIINYDKKYAISYYSALKIAEKKGFKMPEIEVALQVDSASTFWQITRWTENENHGGKTGEALLIDTKTGKVTKPKFHMT